MLEEIKIAQFRGINTITDSSNLGVAMARECKNNFLRPLGGLSVPAAWNALTCNGTALDFGFVNNIDYLFDGARLLLQSATGEWWDVSPDPTTGTPMNSIVSYAGSTLVADLTLTAGQYLAFKYGSNYFQSGADQRAMGWFIENLGNVPYYTTRYTSDRAFENGFGPKFTDGDGNVWKYRALPGLGLDAYIV
jgi:hypothetical protein